MIARFLWVTLLIPVSANAQVISTAAHEALKQSGLFLNGATEQVNQFVVSLAEIHTEVSRHRLRPQSQALRYTCSIDVGVTDSPPNITGLRSAPGFAQLQSALQAYLTAFQNLDTRCRELEVYFRLQEYNRDGFSGYDGLVTNLLTQLTSVQSAGNEWASQVHAMHEKLQPYKATLSYAVADRLMREQLSREREVLNQWSLNLNKEARTPWLTDQLREHVLQNDETIARLKRRLPIVNYPASAMINSFMEGLLALQQVKRTGIDEYTYVPRQTDEYTNQWYLQMINHYNGVCVSFYNQFLFYATNDGYRGVPYAPYQAVAVVRNAMVRDSITWRAFKDVDYIPPDIQSQSLPIPTEVFESLSRYLVFINEGVRQLNNLMQPVRNLNGSVVYAVEALSQGKKPQLHYYDNSFQVPVTSYDLAGRHTQQLPETCRQSLLDQVTVLFEIVQEVDRWNSTLIQEGTKNNLGADEMKLVSTFLARYQLLTEQYNTKKQQLYEDLRDVYESYALVDSGNSWRVSGCALQHQVDLNYKQLDLVRHHFSSGEPVAVSTEALNAHARELVINEYTNLKGIEKIGRNNGLCPYSPYEDVAEYSGRLAGQLAGVLGKPVSNPNRHPYNELIYRYNEIVEEQNRFNGLAKVPLLKNVKQLEFFRVQSPAWKPVPEQSLVQSSMEAYAVNNTVLLLDVSGSMSAPDKLPLLKEAVKKIISIMRPEDEVAIVVFSTKGRVALPTTSFTNKDKIESVITNLKLVGTTNANAGIRLAYQVAQKNFIEKGNNRVILATDGEFPVDRSLPQLIQSAPGIYLSIFCFGSAQSTGSLEELAREGKGNFTRITPENVELTLHKELKAIRKE